MKQCVLRILAVLYCQVTHSHSRDSLLLLFVVVFAGPGSSDCLPVGDGLWTYIPDEDTAFFLDIGDHGFVDPGDAFIFDQGPISVEIENTMIASGIFSGTCTATTEMTPEREYCILNFDFGDLGTIAAQGPMEEMAITGTTGCFWYFVGSVVGYLEDDNYKFYVALESRR